MLLIGIRYSPWTERVRLVLRHHQLSYNYEEHTLLLGMPRLCWQMRRMSPNLTVPALIDGTNHLMDSFQIARYLDRLGQKSRLIPDQWIDLIAEFNVQAELGCSAVRVLMLERMKHSQEARLAALPDFVPTCLRPSLGGMAKLGMAYIRKEFSISAESSAQSRVDLKSFLVLLRRRLTQAGGKYIMGELSYADLIAVTVLQGVLPVSNRFLELKAPIRQIWTDEVFKIEFVDLLQWRDQIYEELGQKST